MPESPSTARPALTPIRKESFGYTEARHLLLRAGFGGTPEQIQTLVEWGPEKSVDYLVDVDKAPQYDVDSSSITSSIMGPPDAETRERYRRARQTSDEEALARLQLERQRRQSEDRAQMRKIQQWWLTRLIETPRPLEEKMTLFWHGHFATSYRTIEDSYHMFAQNRLYRTHAVGGFGTLMHQVIRDPAMLAYLDNNDSRKNRPNENLARELMELFGLGVGNYSEQDIKEGARALTGYTFQDDAFTFQRQNHDGGAKRILGRAVAGDGVAILDRDRSLGQRRDVGPGHVARRDDPRVALRRPDMGEVGLAGPARAHQHQLAGRPRAPALDHRHGGGVGRRYEEVVAPERSAHRQVEAELAGHYRKSSSACPR